MDRSDVMLSYLPDFMRNSQPLSVIIETEGRELGDLNQYIKDILTQFFVQTATWGMCCWEEGCGLPVETSLSYADRRTRVLAALRGAKACTLGTVREVIKAFTGLEVVCYETDLKTNIALSGEVINQHMYPFTIRRKFLFIAGCSTAGEDVWGEDYASTLMLNLTQHFRAGMSAAGDQVFELNPDYAYLQGGSLVDKSSLRVALKNILPVQMQLIIN